MTPETLPATFKRILISIREHLEYIRECGVEGLPLLSSSELLSQAQDRPPAAGLRTGPAAGLRTGPDSAENKLTQPQLPATGHELLAGKAKVTPPSTPQPNAGLAEGSDLFLSPGVNQARTLTDLRSEIGDCQRCGLCQSRTHIVFGVGHSQADLVFVGEAPGRDEDVKGEPFVGRAGQLLTEIITKGMGLRREEVYIANVVKCRPPDNRNPEAEEIAACEPFLVKQLELIQPRVIVALGTFAAQTLLKTRTPITRLRGGWHNYHGIKLMPTFHPAYLLRNPQEKKIVWKDIQEVMRELGIKAAVRTPRPGSGQTPRPGSGQGSRSSSRL